jgi:hypothetical protein
MCFSFIFYFSLNKQARHEFSQTIGCMCPWSIGRRNKTYRNKSPNDEYGRTRRLQYHTRHQYPYPQNNNNNNQRIKTTKFNTHQMIVPPTPLLIDRQNNKKLMKPDTALSKRTVLTYGCHVQCCP